MIKEEKNIDFYTTGRQPSEKDFERISEWIKNKKRKNETLKPNEPNAKRKIILRKNKCRKSRDKITK